MPRINLYIRDVGEFRKLQEEVRFLWYKTYGESLKMNALINQALIITKNYLENDSQVNEKKIEYLRTGFDN